MPDETLNPYQLAMIAEVAGPDSPVSPGAKWLTRVAEHAVEVREHVEADDDLADAIHEAADSIVPIYTHERWRVFVDLAAYTEDADDLGGFPSDLTDAAGVALYLIAERLLYALLDDDEDGHEDKARDVVDIRICTDCLVWHANGDTSGIDDPEHEAAVRRAPGIGTGWTVVPGNSDDDEDFSWSQCDACRTPLGGPRHAAVLLRHPGTGEV